jgi:hypothetical protein
VGFAVLAGPDPQCRRHRIRDYSTHTRADLERSQIWAILLGIC